MVLQRERTTDCGLWFLRYSIQKLLRCQNEKNRKAEHRYLSHLFCHSMCSIFFSIFLAIRKMVLHVSILVNVHCCFSLLIVTFVAVYVVFFECFAYLLLFAMCTMFLLSICTDYWNPEFWCISCHIIAIFALSLYPLTLSLFLSFTLNLIASHKIIMRLHFRQMCAPKLNPISRFTMQHKHQIVARLCRCVSSCHFT